MGLIGKIGIAATTLRSALLRRLQLSQRSREFTLKMDLGFTLIELLVAIAMVAILVTIGVPSYTYITTTVRMDSERNALVGDMQYARSEAIKEGATVSICASTNQTTCSTSANWQSGWIVFSDPLQSLTPPSSSMVFRVRPSFSGGETFTAGNSTSAVTFNREGFAQGLPTQGVYFTLHNATGDTRLTRCLFISLVGLLTTSSYNGGTCL